MITDGTVTYKFYVCSLGPGPGVIEYPELHLSSLQPDYSAIRRAVDHFKQTHPGTEESKLIYGEIKCTRDRQEYLDVPLSGVAPTAAYPVWRAVANLANRTVIHRTLDGKYFGSTPSMNEERFREVNAKAYDSPEALLGALAR
jgi:hypothetical protein